MKLTANTLHILKFCEAFMAGFEDDPQQKLRLKMLQLRAEINRLEKGSALDLEIIARHDDGVKHRAFVELAVCRALIQRLTVAGYTLTVDDGDGERKGGTEDELIALIFGVDDSYLLADKSDDHSWVSLVMGNDGHDVISDYSTTLEEIMAPLSKWIDAHQTDGTF